VQVTPDVSRFILDSANPLSISQIYADNPLTLQIDPQGFALPLFPFDLTQFTFSKARIELGKIRCKNEGGLNFTLSLLKSKQFTNNRELLLWFAPMDLKLQKGILEIERTEILIADTFDIALWGHIDLVKDYVDMVLGLTANALQAAFPIPNLPNNYVLQIPMKGPTHKVVIDQTQATAKIALLLAWQQKILSEVLKGKSPAGFLFGELLNKLGPLPDFDKKPPPAKQPFPWETYEPRKKKNTHKSKHNFKDKPLKQILKILR